MGKCKFAAHVYFNQLLHMYAKLLNITRWFCMPTTLIIQMLNAPQNPTQQ